MSLATRSHAIAPVLALAALFLASTPAPARADITAFLGVSPTPERHTVKGFSFGLSLVVVGFEAEFADLGEDPLESLPGLKTYSGNVFVQTPVDVKGTRFYATTGVSGYRETLGTQQETHMGFNVGGGLKVRVLGPVRLRLDYRIFQLRGDPLHSTYQRFYAGANIAF